MLNTTLPELLPEIMENKNSLDLDQLALLSLGLAIQQMEGTATRLKPSIVSKLRAKLQALSIEIPPSLQPDADLNDLSKSVNQLLAELTR